MERLYQYTRLQVNQIRTLTLYPGEPGQVLKGELNIVHIDSAVTYEAISYVWGSRLVDRTHHMECNGKQLHLTQSLHEALQRVRLPDKPRRLWADQICINQDHIDERSAQVQLMNVIFRNATHVLVWLGQKGRKAAAYDAFQTIKNMTDILKGQTGKTSNMRWNFWLDHMSVQKWNSLRELTLLPWFQRQWIVQEIGTKNSATLFYGECQMDWTTMHAFCEQLSHYHDLRKFYDVRTSKIKYLFQRFVPPEAGNRHANRFSFIYELHRARHLKCLDSRDRIFAMLGHYSIQNGSNKELMGLKSDYRKTVHQVYTDTAIRAVTGDHHSLITMAAVQHANLPSRWNTSTLPVLSNGLPSWVPDWRHYESHILAEPTSPHHTARDTRADIIIDVESYTLQATGIQIDRVVNIQGPIKPKAVYETSVVFDLWKSVIGKETLDPDMSLFLESEGTYPGADESKGFALLQTLSNGCAAIAWEEDLEYEQVDPQTWLAYGLAYLNLSGRTVRLEDRCGRIDVFHAELPAEEWTSVRCYKWARAVDSAASNRAFATTERGYYVLGPRVIEDGDVICVLNGGKVPFVLRPWGERFLLVGECYVHGFMKGEAIDMRERGELVGREFLVV